MIVPLLLFAAACVPLRDPVLHAGDLAVADPLFQSVEPSTRVGYAPVPGSRRVISESEMARLAKQFGLAGSAHELCFEWAMKKLSAEVVVEGMKKALPGAEVNVLELPTFEVPDGAVRFPVASLPKGRPDESLVWRGFVEYAPGRNFAIWARVRIAVTGKRVELRRDVAAGETISSEDMELREFRGFPGSARWIESTEEAVGRKLLLGVKAGNWITSSVLAPAGQVVDRGDEVTVEVRSGGALIKVSAKAESSGAVGQTVRFRNPKSGKLFEGRVTGKGSASVVAAESEENR